MKVEFFGSNGCWYWIFGGASCMRVYTRRRDAVRGFERFCAAIKGVK